MGKRDKMRGLPTILSVFRNKFNKFNNTGAWILDTIYHMTLRLIKNHIFWREKLRFCHRLSNVKMDVIILHTNL